MSSKAPLSARAPTSIYDRRFTDSIERVMSEPESHPITDDDAIYLWCHTDAPED